MKKTATLITTFRLLLLILLISLVLLINNDMKKEQYPTQPSWFGITPGKTTLQEVIEILGEPNEIENKSFYPTRSNNQYFENSPNSQIFIYKSRFKDWQHVEIWFENKNNDNIVFAVLLTLREITPQTPVSLGSLVSTYGKPNEITWTLFPNTRYLIWSNYGIAASASTDIKVRENNQIIDRDLNEINVGEILYFQPTLVSEIFSTQWPWPNNGAGWVLDNLFQGGSLDFAGNLPKDPYNWNNLP